MILFLLLLRHLHPYIQKESMHLKEGLCIKKVCLKTCPETFLNCFVLNTLSSKAKQLRNVLE